MNALAQLCIDSANRARHLALTATDEDSRAYWTASANRWIRRAQAAIGL